MEQPAVGKAGETWSGILAGGHFPDELRKSGVDEATRVTYLTRDINMFTYLIHKNNPFSGTKTNVNDREYITREIGELDRFYKVSVPSSTTGVTANANHKVFGLANKDAVQIRANDMLFIPQLLVNVVASPVNWGQVTPSTATALGTNIGPDSNESAGFNPTRLEFSRTQGVAVNGSVFMDCEQMKVISVGLPDSAGVGHSLITVDRCFMGPGENDRGGALLPRSLVYGTQGILGTDNGGINHTNNAWAVIQLDDKVFRGVPSFMEGTNAPTGIYKNPVSFGNFSQEYKYACEQTEESEIPQNALWIDKKDTGLQINRWLTTRQANRDREYANLFNRKAKIMSQGREEYISGGVIPWIIKDLQHLIIYPQASLTWQNALFIGRDVFALGGSSKRIGLIGVTLDACLRNAYWQPGILQYNKEASKNFNMEVNTLYLSGGTIDLIVSQVLEENGWGGHMLCLDMSKADAFEPVTHKGWDYKYEKDIQLPGSSMYKEQIKGIFGLHRRYRPFHCIIDFRQAIAYTGIQSGNSNFSTFAGRQPDLNDNSYTMP